MQGLESLTHYGSTADTSCRTATLEGKFRLPVPKHTPDLVLDLPIQSVPSAESASEADSGNPFNCASSQSVAAVLCSHHLGSHSTAADTFAAHDSQDTLKKAVPMALLEVVRIEILAMKWKSVCVCVC